jgi:fimbrial isopeptide formation D2 family protein
MFKKLVTNLPFNPGLLHQVGFYADRLRQERSIRRLSFVFMALAMAVQSLAVISPPEKSYAYSPNHILSNIQSKSQILAAFDNNTKDFREIYERFYITRADLAALSNTPNDTIVTNDGKHYRTIGRNSLWNYSKVDQKYKKTERKFFYENFEDKEEGNHVYIRDLKAWDIENPFNYHAAYRGTVAATGQTFWIIASCGNLTWIPPYDQPTPEDPPPPEPEPEKPQLDIRKTIVGNPSTLKPGDEYTYNIEFRNSKKNSVAENVVIRDELDIKNSFDVVNVSTPYKVNRTANGVLTVDVGDVRGENSYQSIKIKVRLKNPLPREYTSCNAARIQASNASAVTTKDVCVDVVTPCPYDASVKNINNENCTKPVVKCQLVDAAVNLATRTVKYKTIVSSSNKATTEVYGYNYDFGDDSPILVNEATGFTDTATHVYSPGKYDAKVTIVYGADGVEGKQQKDCVASIDFEEDKPFTQEKLVSNLTQELDDATDKTVQAGDVLAYTLVTTNTQNYERTNITIEDYIGDVLDYATLDLEALKTEGGTFDEETNKVTWNNVTLPANSRVELTFHVELKDPIPATNRPSTTAGDFDCKIENTYGNIITLGVNCPVVKGIETLPNTGPGTSLIAGTAVTAVVGYLFARARLLSKEIQIIRTDYASTGGM